MQKTYSSGLLSYSDIEYHGSQKGISFPPEIYHSLYTGRSGHPCNAMREQTIVDSRWPSNAVTHNYNAASHAHFATAALSTEVLKKLPFVRSITCP